MTKNLSQLSQSIDLKKVHIFDMDGTIVDLEELNFTTFSQILKQAFNLELTQEEYQEYFSGAGSRNGFKGYVEAHQIEHSVDDLVTQYREIKDQILNSRMTEVVKLKDGVVEYLDLLDAKGKKLVLATSSFYDFAVKICRGMGLYDKFDIFLTEKDIAKNKPDPEIFNKARDLTGAKSEECIIYEDSKNGIISALASGIYCIGIYNPGLNDDYIETADAIIESFHDISSMFTK